MSTTRTRIMYIQRGTGPGRIDEDVREEYGREVRGEPEQVARRSFRSDGVHGRHATR